MAVEAVSGPTYNTDKGQRFKMPGSGKDEYWVKVDKDTGNVQIFQSQPGIILDKRVGTMDPKSGEIVFNELWGGATKEQKELFSQPESKKIIKDISGATVTQDLIEEGKDVTTARQEAAELTGSDGGLFSKEVIQNNMDAEIKKSANAREGTRKQFGTFVYPSTLRQDDQDLIRFTILEYKPKKFKARSTSLDFFEDRGSLNDRVPKGSITLPIPANINDTNAVEWGADSMNAIQAALANIGMEFLTGRDVMGEVSKTAGGIAANKEELKASLGTAVVEAATGSAGGSLLTRTTGNIMNPNMELLFKKPTLRPFEFTFKLSPRSSLEAKQVIGIIRTFKQSMAVIRSASNLFLKTPHTYKLQYIHRNKEHPFLNRFKECALMNMSVNYTPDGNYATYEDGIMTSYEMRLAFTEIEPVFNDEYGKDDTSIGY
tara:strand:- start:937 stop:2229 length:1293 start_codon:yes stop_codon:yes gene_type:complete